MRTSRVGSEQHRRASREDGVTLLELIVVMIILSLMLGLVAPRFGVWMDNWKLRTAAERIAQTLRDARNRAVYEQRYYVVVIEPGGSQGDTPLRVRMIEPASGWIHEYTLPAGITVVEDQETRPDAVFRLTAYPSGGMEERTLRLRNSRGHEVDVHINFLLDGPEIVVAARQP
jgi:prepilin-type N-terminal cleavage/methylation domain-containing protein